MFSSNVRSPQLFITATSAIANLIVRHALRLEMVCGTITPSMASMWLVAWKDLDGHKVSMLDKRKNLRIFTICPSLSCFFNMLTLSWSDFKLVV